MHYNQSQEKFLTFRGVVAYLSSVDREIYRKITIEHAWWIQERSIEPTELNRTPNDSERFRTQYHILKLQHIRFLLDYQLGDFSASLLFNAWIWSYFPLVIVFRHGERFSKLCLPSCIGFTRYPVLSSKLTMFWLEDTFYGWMLLFSLDSFQPDNCFFFS